VTGPRLCPKTNFGIIDVKPSVFLTTVSIRWIFREGSCEDWRWMELAQDRVHWWAL
jgi:hypothetical protein